LEPQDLETALSRQVSAFGPVSPPEAVFAWAPGWVQRRQKVLQLAEVTAEA